VLCAGSVGLASVRNRGRDSKAGFVRRCKELKRRELILTSLGGMAVESLYYAETEGCCADIKSAVGLIREEITKEGICGLGLVNIKTEYTPEVSENLNVRNEAVTHAKLECFLIEAKKILLENRTFLEKTAEALVEKEALLYSDVQTLKELYAK
jgi:cell division protease FtsH